MSRGLNKIMLIGNLGRDPEMRFTPSGKPVTDFSIAVSRRRRSPEGENIDETEWFRIVCWDRLAEISDQYLNKGSKIYVEGRVQVRKYTGNDGQERTSVDVIASELIILTPRGESSGGYRESPSKEPRESGRAIEEDFDDVPF
ncbi:MAG TPA: single-stranded DNA-binding protein [Nitrolancea sp.]|nr:single-stranded DNA-binding protein [Nitrolancea sp.]